MFIPRLSAPLPGNKYYIRKSSGWNPCILGNPLRRDKSHNVLPNCVGWACGRFNEIGGYDRCKYILNCDAKNFITVAKAMGLKTGTEPKLGAIIVWTNSQYGHVGVVEEILSPSEITISESGWNFYSPMRIAKHYKGDGNWLNGTDIAWMNGRYKFAGFVYNPAVKDGETTMETTPVKVKYNGKVVTIQENYVSEGTNYTSLRKMFEALGFQVGWDAASKVVTIE